MADKKAPRPAPPRSAEPVTPPAATPSRAAPADSGAAPEPVRNAVAPLDMAPTRVITASTDPPKNTTLLVERRPTSDRTNSPRAAPPASQPRK